MIKRKPIVYLLLFALLLQFGCSSITQIPYPVDERKSENDIRRLNYLGEKLSATIRLIDSTEVTANWLSLSDNRLYLLTNRLDEPPYYEVSKIKSIKFYDWWRGCLGGGMFSILFGSLIFGIADLTKDKNEESNFSFAPIIITVLSLGYGMYALGEIEFSFVQNK